LIKQSWLVSFVLSCLQADSGRLSEAGMKLASKDSGDGGDSNCGNDNGSNNVSHDYVGGDCNGGDGDGDDSDGNGNGADGGNDKQGVATGSTVGEICIEL